MIREYPISVAMATYNGEKYIEEQIKSIINNLNQQDELIISDDGSTDSTLNIIKSFNDNRIKVFNGPQKGVIKNFENAIKKCKGKYIFLSDQDDLWMDNKVDIVLEAFEQRKCKAIVHDAVVVNGDMTEVIMPSYFENRKTKKGKIVNFIKPSYLGCCMAVSGDLLNVVLPFPNRVEMHDRWIGSIYDIFDRVEFLNIQLIKYRRHENNVSHMQRNGLFTILRNRLYLLKELLKRKKALNGGKKK